MKLGYVVAKPHIVRRRAYDSTRYNRLPQKSFRHALYPAFMSDAVIICKEQAVTARYRYSPIDSTWDAHICAVADIL
jgi:hypothetical protein